MVEDNLYLATQERFTLSEQWRLNSLSIIYLLMDACCEDPQEPTSQGPCTRSDPQTFPEVMAEDPVPVQVREASSESFIPSTG